MIVAANVVNNLSEQGILRELYNPTNIFDIMYWCKDYETRNKFPATLLNRFAIGFYQIHQGMAWKDNGVNKYESFAAAALHFSMLVVRLNLPLELHMPVELKDFKDTEPPSKWAETLLYYLSAAQQQLFYGQNPANRTQRKSRYNEEKLDFAIGTAIKKLIAKIPEEIRSECFERSTAIMTKDLR